MLPFDSLTPYILASMHPLMHMSMLFTGCILMSLDYKKFFEAPAGAKCKAGTPAATFMDRGRYNLMNIACFGHVIGITCHIGHKVFQHYKYNFLANILLVAKILVYFYCVVYVQAGITYDECNDVTDQMHVMAWLTYEVWVFYVNILGIMFFLFVASFVQFRSIRDRLGFAGNMRTRMDFLRYCENDIHWW